MFHQVDARLITKAPMRRCRLGECRAACCLYGVWADAREAEDVVAHAQLIEPHMPAGREDAALWFDGRREPDEWMPTGVVTHSAVVDDPGHYGGTACGFLRSDFKCALQVAGEAAGLHPWRFKPFYCILHPLDIDEQGRITLDEDGLLLDEPGSCLRPADEVISLVETFEPELRYFLGDKRYRKLADQDGEEID